MKKVELIEFMAESAGLTKADAGRAIDAFVEGVKKGLKENGKVTLVGFGTFNAKLREAREGRNPATGETMKFDAKMVASFKAGSPLKDYLNK